MIDKKKLADLLKEWENPNTQTLKLVPQTFDVDEAILTIEALLKENETLKLQAESHDYGYYGGADNWETESGFDGDGC
jgi:hypothetical protein